MAYSEEYRKGRQSVIDRATSNGAKADQVNKELTAAGYAGDY